MGWNPDMETWEERVKRLNEKSIGPEEVKALQQEFKRDKIVGDAAKMIARGQNPLKEAKKIAKVENVSKKEVVNEIEAAGIGILPALEAAGVTMEKIAEVIKDGLSATTTKYFSHEGVVTDSRDAVDYTERRQYSDMVLKLTGAYPKDGVKIDVTHRIIRLPAKLEAGEGATEREVQAEVVGEES